MSEPPARPSGRPVQSRADRERGLLAEVARRYQIYRRGIISDLDFGGCCLDRFIGADLDSSIPACLDQVPLGMAAAFGGALDQIDFPVKCFEARFGVGTVPTPEQAAWYGLSHHSWSRRRAVADAIRSYYQGRAATVPEVDRYWAWLNALQTWPGTACEIPGCGARSVWPGHLCPRHQFEATEGRPPPTGTAGDDPN